MRDVYTIYSVLYTQLYMRDIYIYVLFGGLRDFALIMAGIQVVSRWFICRAQLRFADACLFCSYRMPIGRASSSFRLQSRLARSLQLSHGGFHS